METFEAVMQYVFGGAAGMVIVMLILTFLRIADQRLRHREMGRWRRELESVAEDLRDRGQRTLADLYFRYAIEAIS